MNRERLKRLKKCAAEETAIVCANAIRERIQQGIAEKALGELRFVRKGFGEPDEFGGFQHGFNSGLDHAIKTIEKYIEESRDWSKPE